MRNRVVRLFMVLLLLGAAAGGAYVVRADVAPSPEEGATRELDQDTDRLLTLVGDLAATQAAYVAPTADSSQALERVPNLLREVMSVSGHLAASLHSDEAGKSLRTFVDETSALAHADASAREHLLLGDTETAAQVIFGDAREATRAMTTALVALRAAERQGRLASTASDAGRSGTILAIVAALWAGGLIVLALIPAAPRTTTAGAEASAAAARSPAAITPDLSAVATLCGEIAKVETATQLSALLARAVTVLDANGIVVWMSAGDTLHPVAAAGSPAIPLSRLTPIDRHEVHYAASAWTRGSIETTATSPGEPGVLAIPLFAGAVAKGVLAVELQSPAMESPTVRALATLIAAQLSTVVTGSSSQASGIGNQKPGEDPRALSSA